MIKFLNRKNKHDILNQYHYVKSNQKVKLVQVNINTNNNKLIKQSKIINPLYFYLNSLIGQKSKIKLSKKSIAAFKVRPNMPIGTIHNLHNYILEQFYYIFITTIINTTSINYSVAKNNKSYNILISFPNYDLNNIILNKNNIIYNFLGGSNIQ